MMSARSKVSFLTTRAGRGTVFATLVLALIAVAIIMVSSSASAARDSGVRGRVWLGPLVPVEHVGGPPNERPYAATIKVLAANGRVVTTTRSTKSGFFTVNLAAGRYVLQGVAATSSSWPHARPVAVVVKLHRFTVAAISFDTGIR
jgi:hypothetical protein